MYPYAELKARLDFIRKVAFLPFFVVNLPVIAISTAATAATEIARRLAPFFVNETGWLTGCTSASNIVGIENKVLVLLESKELRINEKRKQTSKEKLC